LLQSNNNNNHKITEEIKSHNLKDGNQQLFETTFTTTTTTTTKTEDEELGHVIRADHDYIELRVQVKEEIPETIDCEDFKPEIEPGDLTIDEQVKREKVFPG